MDVIERLKRMDLAGFLERAYGLSFAREGDGYVSLSPFRAEKRGSFYVRQEGDGHWVFKDHGSGVGGSVFDLVMAFEKLGTFGAALRRLCGMTGVSLAGSANGAVEAAGLPAPSGLSVGLPGAPSAVPANMTKQASGRGGSSSDGLGAKEEVVGKAPELGAAGGAVEKGYDIEGLYARFREADGSVCREYLVGRGIDADLAAELVATGTVVWNRFSGGSYCCFAVRDGSGRLQCLYNRELDGERKFVLGRKAPFTLDWEQLGSAEKVYLCEGPIDYLSLKTLEGRDLVGLALLGNAVNVTREMMPCCRQIVAAFDGDRGGFSAAYDVCEAFSELGPVRVYELDDCKDPNELLQARRRQESRELSATEKLSLYREFTAATNKSSVVRKWGLSRSYVYAVVGECEKAIVDGFASRRRGRRGRNESGDLAAERQRIADLERRVEEESREREKLYCRSEFLQLRLKWAEIEAAEARGEKADGCGNVVAKRQAKKKRKKKR